MLFAGGEYEHRQKFMGGPLADLFFNQLKANKAFVAAGGISLNEGITDYDITGAAISKKLIERAENTIILADYTKFGVSTFAHICHLEDVAMVITDKKSSTQWQERLAQKKVELLIAGEILEDVNV